MRFLTTLSLLTVAAVASAADPVTIPTTGCDIGGFITAGITAVAAVVAVAVGGYFAFLIVKKGIRWASKAMG